MVLICLENDDRFNRRLKRKVSVALKSATPLPWGISIANFDAESIRRLQFLTQWQYEFSTITVLRAVHSIAQNHQFKSSDSHFKHQFCPRFFESSPVFAFSIPNSNHVRHYQFRFQIGKPCVWAWKNRCYGCGLSVRTLSESNAGLDLNR